MKRVYIITGIAILLINIIPLTIALDVSIDSTDDDVVGVNMELPEEAINYSLIPTVNSSDYWDNKDTHNSTQMTVVDAVLTILPSWVLGLIDSVLWTAEFNATGDGRWGTASVEDIWINETGDTMEGNFTLKNESVKINDANNDINMFFENGVLVVEG